MPVFPIKITNIEVSNTENAKIFCKFVKIFGS